MIEEMDLWEWKDANKDFWSRLAKTLQMTKVSVMWAEELDNQLAVARERPRKDQFKLGNSDKINTAIQKMDSKNRRFTRRHLSNSMGFTYTYLEFTVDRGRGNEKTSPDFKEIGIQEHWGSAKDKGRPQV